MMALSVCQPWAELIARGEKRVENRTWQTKKRGAVLIHAGKTRGWLGNSSAAVTRQFGLRADQLTFGAILCRALLIDCVRGEAIVNGSLDAKYPWLPEQREKRFVYGPWCFLLDDARRFPYPIPARGRLQFFDFEIPEEKPA